MNIQDANVNELKSYVESLMKRCEAIVMPFGYVAYENFRTEPLASCVPEVAELVELSRLAQCSLARLIEIDGQNVERHITNKTLGFNFSQFDNVTDTDTEEMRSSFLQLIHMIYGQSLTITTYFRESVNTGLILDEEMDYSEHYAKYREQLAEIHELCLLAQIGLAHILRADNKAKFREGA